MAKIFRTHYGDVVMGPIASQITSITIVYSTVYSDADQRKHKTSASPTFVWGIHRGPVNSPHKWPVTRKIFHLLASSWSNHAQNIYQIKRAVGYHTLSSAGQRKILGTPVNVMAYDSLYDMVKSTKPNHKAKTMCLILGMYSAFHF